MANKRTILHLTPEAVEAIERNIPSPNKRGAWASQAIVAYDRQLHQPEPTTNDVGVLEQIADRLARLERQVAALTAMLQERDGK